MKLEEYKDKILNEDSIEKREQILLDAVNDEAFENKEFVDLMNFTLKVKQEVFYKKERK